MPMIDCDAKPRIPEGWSLIEHKKGGSYAWDPSRIARLLVDESRDGTVDGAKLLKVHEDEEAFNANVLDFLLSRPDLIPEEWKGKTVVFRGTVYKHRYGAACVRCLSWFGRKWRWRCILLAEAASSEDQPAV